MLCCVSYATNEENTNKCGEIRIYSQLKEKIFLLSASDKVLVSFALARLTLKYKRSLYKYRIREIISLISNAFPV